LETVTGIVKSQLLIYSIILDIVMIVYLLTQESRKQYSSRLFVKILLAIITVSFSEALTYLTGDIGNASQIPLHYWANVIYLSMGTLPGAIGMTYLDFKIFGLEVQSRKRFFVYMIPFYLSAGLTLFNFIKPEFLFYIDPSNIYRRGPGVLIEVLFLWLFLAGVLIFFYRSKYLFTGRLTQGIVIFSLTPVLGSAIQMLVPGSTFTMPAYTLAAFMTLLILERDEMAKDPLTRLYTRKNLENRILFKLKSNEPFSVVLIDLNDFKNINDNFGHPEGDKVLHLVARILLECTKIEDMVCRYGGDEFCLLIEHKEDVGEKLISRIESELKRYSEKIGKYRIWASFGYVFVDDPSDKTLAGLINEADQRMYRDKVARKAGR